MTTGPVEVVARAPPPIVLALMFLLKVLSFTVIELVLPWLTPPPVPAAVLLANVQLLIVIVPPPVTKAPPAPVAVLLVNWLKLIVCAPAPTRTAPPPVEPDEVLLEKIDVVIEIEFVE